MILHKRGAEMVVPCLEQYIIQVEIYEKFVTLEEEQNLRTSSRKSFFCELVDFRDLHDTL